MTLRFEIERRFEAQVDELTDHSGFRRLESGLATTGEYDAFVANLIRTHSKSPQLVAFLYALAPPAAADDLLDNLLEELGLDEQGVSHPALLVDLARGAGLMDALPHLEAMAVADIRRLAAEPIMFGSLREVGLGAFVEICAFEFMLSRVASRLSQALATHRGLDVSSLTWFTLHSEVDVGHAEQGLAALEEYATHYGISDDDALAIVDLTLRRNVFVRRYFPPVTAAAAITLPVGPS